MKILHVSCSPRGQASESYAISQKIIGFLLKSEPTAILVNRVIGGGALSHIDENYATALGTTQPSSAGISQEGSISLSEDLIQELESSDFVVIGTPMHNFTVPSALKAWIDHIVRVRRTFNVTTEGKVGALRDRPVFIAVSSGGRYSGERARQPDFLTPYLKAILSTIGLHDLTFFSTEGTALGPEAVAEARTKTDQALQEYFSSFCPQSRPAWASDAWARVPSCPSGPWASRGPEDYDARFR
ncbi:MAG TPA: NAD(P)H-dependent oxidoreductase [Reyranella sp.]|jgi:FMN-dependent NADH-azoreductase|nr:NAD(P)H-dependent oxidoreductase [Reyranella sp.]